jgi:hypothetical protein
MLFEFPLDADTLRWRRVNDFYHSAAFGNAADDHGGPGQPVNTKRPDSYIFGHSKWYRSPDLPVARRLRGNLGGDGCELHDTAGE